jgi:exopolysaccharide production protein ExoQ
MPPQIATLVFALGVLGCFILDRDSETHTSGALWLPVAWVLTNGSRPLSLWLNSNAAANMQNPEQYLEGSPFDRFFYSALLVIGLVVLIRRRIKVRETLRDNLPLVLFFSFCVLSICWSDFPFVAFKRWVKAASDLVMVLIILTDPDRVGALKRVIARVGFVLIPASILVIKYYPAIGRIYNIWTWEPMFVGVTDHKNTLGMVCLMLGLGFEWRFILAYGDRANPQRKKRLLVFAVLIAMVVWLLITANSATSLSCFILGTCLMLATCLRTVVKSPKLVHILVGGVLATSIFALLFDSGGSMVGVVGRDATLTGRTEIWKMVINMTENRMVGSGFESFWLGDRAAKMWAKYYFHPNQAHNGYIEIYLELGWIGILLLTMMIISGYKNALAIFAQNPDAGRIRLVFICTGLVYNLTEAGFRMTTTSWFFFLVSIVIVPKTAALKEIARVPIKTIRNFKPSPRPAHSVPSLVRRKLEAV